MGEKRRRRQRTKGKLATASQKTTTSARALPASGDFAQATEACPFPIHEAIRRLRAAAPLWQAPVVTLMAAQNRSPFHVLVGCLLSLRTQDQVTAAAAQRLFALADNPYDLARLPLRTIERAIYPVGFYRTKARVVRDVSRILVEKHQGQVPANLDELLKLKGVGRKTANLVITKGFGLPGICVDTHVHRISNRWGFVCTRSPEQTEQALRQRLPQEYWIEYNDLLVAFGQTICRPISPLCSACPVSDLCPRKGVQRAR